MPLPSFGSDNRWAPFWSAGLGWNLHHEKFLKNVNWLQQLKIRGSYGLTGSQNYDPYQAITTYGYLTGERYHYAVGAIVMAMGNRDLSWTTYVTTELWCGFDPVGRSD